MPGVSGPALSPPWACPSGMNYFPVPSGKGGQKAGPKGFSAPYGQREVERWSDSDRFVPIGNRRPWRGGTGVGSGSSDGSSSARSSGHWIISAGAQWAAAAQASGSKPCPLYQTMLGYRFMRVMRAGGSVPAVSKPVWRDRQLVESYGGEGKITHHPLALAFVAACSTPPKRWARRRRLIKARASP